LKISPGRNYKAGKTGQPEDSSIDAVEK